MRNLIEAIWPNNIRSIIDLGCGDLWFTANLPGVTTHIGVDAWPEQLKLAEERRSVKGWIAVCGDALEFLRTRDDKSVDAVLAIDVIEHLEKDQGLELLDGMERVAGKLVICWAPRGMIERGPYNPDGTPNPFQEHKWGPQPVDFHLREWEVNEYSDWHGAEGGAIFAYKFL